MKKFLFAAALLLMPTFALAQVHYDRNQLPQLSAEILEQSEFAQRVEATVVPVAELKPVQTQRVKDLVKQEARLIKAQQDTYRPLVIDHSYHINKMLFEENIRLNHTNLQMKEIILCN